MSTVLLYSVIFVGGPALFWLMTRAAPDPRNLFRITVFSALSAAAGLVAWFAAGASDPPHIWLIVAAAALMWLAWIGLLALGTQTVRQTNPSQTLRRVSGVIGALGTTVPWFGFAAARMMAG